MRIISCAVVYTGLDRLQQGVGITTGRYRTVACLLMALAAETPRGSTLAPTPRTAADARTAAFCAPLLTKVLNYSDPAQLAMAEKLRDCEVPFKVVGECT